jgi:hypothetical protein
MNSAENLSKNFKIRDHYFQYLEKQYQFLTFTQNLIKFFFRPCHSWCMKSLHFNVVFYQPSYSITEDKENLIVVILAFCFWDLDYIKNLPISEE